MLEPTNDTKDIRNEKYFRDSITERQERIKQLKHEADLEATVWGSEHGDWGDRD